MWQAKLNVVLLGAAVLVALTAAPGKSQAQSESIEAKCERLERVVTQLREETERLQLQVDSQPHCGSLSPPACMLPGESGAIPVSYDELTATPDALPIPADVSQPLTPDIEQLQFRVQRLEQKVDQLGDSLTISLLNKEWSAAITGALIGEMIYSQQRPLIPSAIVLITPDFDKDTPTVDIHGKSSKIGVLLRGPDLMGLQTGGAMLAYFFGENFLANVAGVNLIGGFAELKNDRWRFLFGRASDLVNPRQPGTLDFNTGRNAGNIGFTRGQFRAERYLQLRQNTQLTTQLALCNPIATAYDGQLATLVESTGWPLLEGRTVLGVGPVSERFGFQSRSHELGVSGLLGQLRRSSLADPAVFKVWAFGVDAKADLTDYFGVRAEFFHGQGLGNLNAGILQIYNPQTLEEVRTIGGWGECYVHWTDCLHSSLGFGIDNPLDSTVPRGLPTQNAFVFGNVIWDVANYAEVGFEVAHWDTDYAPAPNLGDNAPGDNDAMIYRTRVVLRF